MAYPWHAVIMACLLLPDVAGAQGMGSVSGEVLNEQGRAVAQAYVRAIELGHAVYADAHGHFELGELTAGPVRIRVRMVGYAGFDTTLQVGEGARETLRVTLRVDEWVREAARAESTRVEAGGVDSLAAALFVTDSSGTFTFERFGIGLLRGSLEASSFDTSRVISPLSAGQALALVLLAARDSTAHLLRQGIGAGKLTAAAVATRSERFNKGIQSRRDITLKIANALWVDTTATLQSAFAQQARRYFDASARSAVLDAPEIVGLLNRWADSATEGLVRQIREEPFGKDVEVVLLNAVYFKGLWLTPFDTARTQGRPFTAAGGQRQPAPTMEQTGSFAYRKGTGYQALRLPYKAGLSAMYLVLPDSGVSPATLLESLHQTGWPIPRAGAENQAVHLRLPRLHVEQATNVRAPFTAMGMGIVFDSTRADFSGLVVPRPNRPPPCPPLSSGISSDACTRYRISEASQHVYLDLDEKGTEAAAVTTIGIEEVVTSAPPPPIEFIVDRPFFLALRDEKTGTFLFMGYIARP